MSPEVLERFLAKIVVLDEEQGGCWQWIAAKHTNGYGQFRFNKRGPGSALPHRASYEHFVGPIPAGLQIDHLCRNRLCVNPDHLEPVTNRENTLRGAIGMRTHCPSGHEYTPENTLLHKRAASHARQCRACHNERARNYYETHRDEINAKRRAMRRAS